MNLPKFEFVTSIEATKSPALLLGWYQTPAQDKESSPVPLYKGKRSKEIDDLAGKIRNAKSFLGKKNEISFLRFFSFA
ncbi:MAG: hypothetical protein ACKOA8_13455, partial [Deltaproteobacteria bacterium]